MSDLSEVESTETPQEAHVVEDGDVALITFGCRLNAYESEVVREQARKAGVSDAVIINTCAVTAEAERQARQAIRRARRERPDARIIVTGCAAQLAPERFAAMPEVDQVLGNPNKLRAESYALPASDSGDRVQVSRVQVARVHVDDVMAAPRTDDDFAEPLLEGFDGRSRAFVQVQQGCDHRCTFCVIPFSRGPSRSAPFGPVVEQARALVESGRREIVLSGVDIAAYGADLPDRPSLGALARRLLDLVPELPRLRLSSLDPAVLDDDQDLWRLLAEEPRFMPHLHLSLQAGDDMILKRMKRRHSRAQTLALCARARAARPDLALGADLIAGFPTETEESFQNTLDLVKDCGLTFLHVFPYSPRPNTPAARMPQVPSQTRRERAARLRQAGDDALRDFLAGQIGKTMPVLIEKPTLGRSPHFAEVALSTPQAVGAVVDVTIVSAESRCLRA